MTGLIIGLACVVALAVHITWLITDGKRAVIQYELEEQIRQMKKKARGES
jgi:hypothetical protein